MLEVEEKAKEAAVRASLSPVSSVELQNDYPFHTSNGTTTEMVKFVN